MSLRLRDEKIKPTVKLQILLYPIVQSVHFDLPSYKENQYDTLLPRDIMVAMWLCYAQGYLSSCRSIQKTFIFMRIQWRGRGGVRDGLRSSFFHFHAVCGKKNCQTLGWWPSGAGLLSENPGSATGKF